MSVTFVLGRAGSGKSRRCLDGIVESIRRDPLGSPLYWILPRQATFSAERELTCGSRLDAFCRARVVSFDEFGRDVFDDCGGSSIPEITATGRQMVLGHLLRRNRDRLRFFSGVARQPGLAAELDATFAELERCGKSVADLGPLMAELSASNGADLELAPLLDKLHDTSLLYSAYTDFLGQERLDQHRRHEQVQALLSHCSFLKKTTIYVDGFLDFTAFERQILVGAARAGATLRIMLLLDPHSPVIANPHALPDEMSLFRKVEETYRKLYFAFTEENIAINEPVRLEPVRRFGSATLAHVEHALFRDPVRPFEGSEGVELTEAPNREAEVDAAARAIRSLLRRGLRLREIGLLVRDLERYHVLIDASFREHGIPYFVDRRRTAVHHPLLQFLRSVFQIARHDWPHDAVMSLLRCGLAGVSLYDADGLENYVLSHHIRGSAGWEANKPWGYRRHFVAPEEAEGTEADASQQPEALRRQLLEKLRPLIEMIRPNQPLTVRELASEIFNTLERFGVRRELGKWIRLGTETGRFEQAEEHEQVWKNVADLFDQMVDLLGDERISPAEFYDVLESGLDSFDLALTPPTVDQVLVGQADRTRTSQFKAAFVLGLNEGEFPHVPTDGSILTDRDRRTLRHRRIDLDPGLRERLLDERLLGYIALTRASQALFVSRPLANDEGRPTEPSSFWRRLSALLPDAARVAVCSARDPRPADVATPRQLVTSLMRWARSSADPVAGVTDAGWPALYQWLAEYPCHDDGIDLMRYRAWRALGYSNTAGLSPEVAAKLFASPLQASASQLEAYAACPFQHFARYALGLRLRDRQEVTARDLGRLYHELLESALRDVLRRRAAGDRSVSLESVLDQHVERIAGRLSDELMLAGARNRYLLERTRKTLRRISLAQRELLRRGMFRPSHAGVTFGPGGNLPPLRVTTPGGAQVMLRGKIDRVDCVEGSADAAVVDYRLAASRLPVGMVRHGLSLQLLTWLLVLESNGQQLAGRATDPAAAFYLPLLRRIEDVPHPDEGSDPSDPKWHLKLKPRGIFDRRCLGALDKELADGPSAVVQAYIKKDGSPGKQNTTDMAGSEDFRTLLRTVAAKLGELADGILSGNVDVHPYRLNDSSPCTRCDYQSVCRFDPGINKYNYLESVKNADAFAALPKGDDRGQ